MQKVASQPEENEYGRWRAEGHPLTIRYSRLVLEELRLAAVEGFQRIPHGGLEVGAILLGRHDGDTVTVEEWRPAPCEHARGPGFVLSEKDLAGFQDVLEQCASAPELAGLTPIGWFHTHTRSDIFLSSEDCAIHDRFFPQPWQVALVMRVARDQAVTGGFFFRESDGSIGTESSYQEFAVPTNPTVLLRSGRASAAPAKQEPEPARVPRDHPKSARPRRQRPPPPPAYLPAAPPVEQPVLAFEQEGIPRVGFRWRLFVAVALFLGVVTTAVLTHPYWLDTAPEAISLRVEEAEDQLVIRWDHGAAPVRQADRGILEILDGASKRAIPLDDIAVRTGSVTIVRDAEDVQVRLVLFEQGKISGQELARYLGPPVRPQIVEQLEQTQQEKDSLSADVERLQEALRQEAARSQRLREAVRTLENRLRQEERPRSNGPPP